MLSLEIRELFISYFRKKKYKFLTQSKVFNDDPSLFFVNSGMCQLKKYILGAEKPTENYEKLVNYQVCIRAGGKHNDFDDVGKDSYHLTMFEMLGFWDLKCDKLSSKQESILLAYNFLVDVCRLDKNKMYVTYFAGDETIKPDEESLNIWNKILPEQQIVKGSFKDNFWMMAENGPCGVSTEIHYDLLHDRKDGSDFVNKDDPSLIEIWNLVFIEYNKINDKYELLPNMFVDTGMGLERLSMVLQNKSSLYTTDVFRPLISYAQIISNAKPYTDSFDKTDLNYLNDVAYRIFADHIRTCVVSIYQDLDFDCVGRGFILRKIFRRLCMNLYIYLNSCTIKPIMNHPVIPALVTQILSFFMWKKHDPLVIAKKLIDEEKLYIGKLYNVKNKFATFMKKINDIDKVKQMLKSSSGIDYEIIDNLFKLRFDVGEYMK